MAEKSTEEVAALAPWHCSVLLPVVVLDAPSPSSRDGVAPETERTHRSWGCTLMCEASVLLKLPQVVAATAQNLLQRFYWRKSLKDARFDAFSIAQGCLFLATKIEEQPRTLRQVLFVFHHIYCKRKAKRDSRRSPLELGGGRYSQWKKKLVESERHILKELGFGFYHAMEHPHKFLLYYIKYLSQQGMAGDEATLRSLAQHAWAYLNDACRLDLCLRHDTKDIACAAILIASRHPDVGVALPTPEWIQALGASPLAVHGICDTLLGAYVHPLPAWVEPLSPESPMCDAIQSVYDESEEGRTPPASAFAGDGDAGDEEEELAEAAPESQDAAAASASDATSKPEESVVHGGATSVVIADSDAAEPGSADARGSQGRDKPQGNSNQERRGRIARASSERAPRADRHDQRCARPAPLFFLCVVVTHHFLTLAHNYVCAAFALTQRPS